jgi:release factor glutamine methyltransferase
VSDGREPTLVATWTAIRQRLKDVGVDNPVLDSRMLLEKGAGIERIEILTDPYRVLSQAQLDAVEALVKRRVAREPVSHIVGHRDFWKHRFNVSAAVLTPRPETEYVVEKALGLLPPDKPARILDLGVGSGAILLSILSERPLATGFGLDASPAALEWANDNAAALGLADRAHIAHGDWRDVDWHQALIEPFDLVVSNPPYISSAEMDGLEAEVRYEPVLALHGGVDGLDAYRQIVAALDHLMKPGGAAVFEVGKGQAEALAEMLRQTGFLGSIEITPDLAGIGRVVSAKRG